MNGIQLQANSQSWIARYGLAMAILEVVLGILCVMGWMDEKMMGGLLIAFGPLTQWVAQNNPGLANQYSVSAAQAAEQAVMDDRAE